MINRVRNERGYRRIEFEFIGLDSMRRHPHSNERSDDDEGEYDEGTPEGDACDSVGVCKEN